MKFNAEQQAILDALMNYSGQIIVGNALAGTGKSTTLEGAARGPLKGERSHYFVFNKQNAEAAKKRFPTSTRVTTAHGYAWGARHPDVPDKMFSVYRGRLVTGSLLGPLRQAVASDEATGRALGSLPMALRMPPSKVLVAVAGVIRLFCQSDRESITDDDVPSEVRAFVEARHNETPDYAPLLQASSMIFQRMRDPKSDFPIDHGVYLKLISLHPPAMSVDTIMFDEAQDANPAMIQILRAQLRQGTRLVLVGDTHQHVYGFTGAVDAMRIMVSEHPDASRVLPLTGSYRFGPEIADRGNILLGLMESPYLLRGLLSSALEDDGRRATLYRGNVAMLVDAVELLSARERVHVVGGVGDAIRLLRAMSNLYFGEFAGHPDLAFFNNWEDLIEFSDTDLGRGWRPLVQLVKRHKGVMTKFIEDLGRAEATEETADHILSTAHRAKGSEWGRVILSSDFNRIWEPDSRGVFVMPDEDELALLYVAMTRGRSRVEDDGLMATMSLALASMKQRGELSERQLGALGLVSRFENELPDEAMGRRVGAEIKPTAQMVI